MRLKSLAGQVARAFVLALFGVLLLPCAPASAQSRDLKEVRARADESLKAFLDADFNRVVELTYPTVIEAMGGKERMVLFLTVAQIEMTAEPGEISFSTDAPEKIIRAGTKLVAIVPTTVKVRIPEGTGTTKSFLIGVSDARGKRKWTFIGGSYLEKADLKTLLPEAAGKIVLPKQPEPVFEKAGEGPGAPD